MEQDFFGHSTFGLHHLAIIAALALAWAVLPSPGLGQSSLSDAGGWPWLDLSESPESLELEELSLPELRASAEDKEEALPAQTICSPSKLLALMASRDRLQQKWPTVSQRNR